MMSIVWLSFVVLFFGFQYIADISFAAVTKKHYNPYQFKNYVDLCIFTIFSIYIVITFVVNLEGTRTLKEGDRLIPWEVKAQIFCRNYAINWVEETTLLIFGLVFMWVRVINFIRYQEDLGRFVTVVKKLVSEIVLYFVLYIINLLTFATIAESAFRNLVKYNTVWEAFKTLFYASFGQFDFDYIENNSLGKNFGISFLIVFLTLNVGLFMSLFISIITVLFGQY